MRQPTKKTLKVHIKSALPIFIAAGVFALCSLIFPIYNFWAILLSAALSVGAYFGTDLFLFKGRDATLTREEYTGNRELDEQIAYSNQIIARFRAAAESAGDASVAAAITRIADASEGIIDEVIDDPEDRSNAYTFFSYYLPTLDKLLGYYSQFSATRSGENANGSIRRIEGCLDMVAGAFEKFLNKLYNNESAEIATGIEALKIMLRMDGLTNKTEMERAKTSKTAYSASEIDAEIENISKQLQNEADLENKQVAAATH
ncbi:MAG: 5-bromo-4-chloroindolyl phosphate hydrolysis family protein [Clostridia bacterium]|nr:5-bromo-4-chloroindolyl phosphate hydrolysis family protein [Clostridia bacterium]